MIGKIMTGKSFGGCLLYCLNDKIQRHQEHVMKNRAEILMFNKCYGDQKELVQQFNDVRRLNPKLSKPVMHVTLSLAPGEDLTIDKWMEMVHQCAKDMGVENNQYIAIQHKDTSHHHVHIEANRVGFDKRTVSVSNSYKKIAGYCRKMELKYELKQVLSPRLYLSESERLLPRQDQRKQQLTVHIQQAFKISRNYHEFDRAIKEKGYQIIKGRGISFIDEKNVKVKGSELNYSLRTIERILDEQRIAELKQSIFKPKITDSDTFARSHQHGKSSSEEWLSKAVSTDLSRTLEVLLKPGQTPGAPEEEQTQKLFKKKRQRHRF